MDDSIKKQILLLRKIKRTLCEDLPWSQQLEHIKFDIKQFEQEHGIINYK